jgi:CubicO group peptidase (beta-lactamase class C family)
MKKLLANQYLILRSINILLITLCLLTFANAGTSQPNSNDTASVKIQSTVQVDQKELELFLNEFFGLKMEQYHIPGLVFLMVKDGEVFFTRGYGYADVQNQKPVSPDETVFQVGSVSKLFTATAVMQLVERGTIDMHTNINQYLKRFKLEENYARPVTMADLLTHSAGFRGRSINSMARRESERVPLGDFLAHNMPTRSMPPGSVISYSNHGNQLAGYLVEEITSIPFEKYVEDNILIPLGMEHSSFTNPANLLPCLAKGYYFSDGIYQEALMEYSRPLISPAGSLIATADDIGHFMIAQLQGGYYQDKCILNEITCREMQKQQFANDKRLPGTCYGFYEYQVNGQRAILHDGDVTGFASRLFLIPDQSIGFFVCNNTSNSILRMELTDSLMRHFFPNVENTKKSIVENKSTQNVKRLAGNYRNTRIGLDYFDKFEAASAVMPFSEKDLNRWIELEPLVYKSPNSNTRLVFRENDEGEITNLFIDAQQMPISYDRVEWYDTSAFLWIPYISIFLVFLVTMIIWLVKRCKKHRIKQVEQTISGTRARLLAYSLVVLNLAFILSFTPSVIIFSDELGFGIPILIKILLIVPIISALSTIGLPIFSVIAWKQKVWSFADRLHYSIITITCIMFVIWLYHWNWLGFIY